MTTADWNSLAERLTKALRPVAAPLAITFSPTRPENIPAFDEPLAEPTPDGRTGRVPAGCVFWIKAGERTFSTVAEDHGNCSVGSLTHGFKTLEEAAQGNDVATLLDSGWVAEEVFPHIPTVTDKPGTVTYGPFWRKRQLIPTWCCSGSTRTPPWCSRTPYPISRSRVSRSVISWPWRKTARSP